MSNTRIAFLIASVVLATATANAQVVNFRLETTDLEGNPVESIRVNDDFLLNAYTQHVGGFEDPDVAGVFAGYLDVSYDALLASIAGDIEHGELYANGKNADLSVPGLLNDIGGFASAPGELQLIELPTPPGIEEQFLFSVPMSATAPGLLEFRGADTENSPAYDVLVWTSLQPVPARDIDFGSIDVRVQFGTASLNIEPVPEPEAGFLGLVGVLGCLSCRYRKRWRSPNSF